MERTSELLALVEIARREGAGRGAVAPPLPPRSPLVAVAAEVVGDISTAAGAVERLHRICHRRGLYDDPTAEVNALGLAIKATMTGLEAKLAAFAKLAQRPPAPAPPPPRPAPTGPAAAGAALGRPHAAGGGGSGGATSPWGGFASAAGTLVSSLATGGRIPASTPAAVILRGFMADTSVAGDAFAAPPASWVAPNAEVLPRLPLPPMAPLNGSQQVAAALDPALQPLVFRMHGLQTAWQVAMAAAWCSATLHALSAIPAGHASGGSPTAFWLAVVDALKARIEVVGERFKAALGVRSTVMKQQEANRRHFSRSAWAPITAADSTLLNGAAEAVLAGTSGPTGMAAGKPADGRGGSSGVAGAGAAARGVASPFSMTARGGRFGGTAAGGATGAAGGFSYGEGLLHRRRAGPGGGGSEGGSATFLPPSAVAAATAAAAGGGGAPGAAGAAMTAAADDEGFKGHAAGAAAAVRASGYTSQQLAKFRDARARASDAHQVEATIVELGSMFHRLTSLVAEQGDTVDRIDADVDTAHMNVEAGHDELQKLYESVSKNRGFLIKLLVVVAVIIAVFAFSRSRS